MLRSATILTALERPFNAGFLYLIYIHKEIGL